MKAAPPFDFLKRFSEKGEPSQPLGKKSSGIQDLPEPGSTLMTPAGNPERATSSQNLSEVSGVTWAGFSTTVLPAAMQAAIFQASIIKG